MGRLFALIVAWFAALPAWLRMKRELQMRARQDYDDCPHAQRYDYRE